MSLPKRRKFRALVTGSTRGIGLAIAERLLKDGMHVISTGTGSSSDVLSRVEYFGVDFSDNDSLNQFLKFVKEAEIDVLVNNAGINKIDAFAEINLEDFDKIHNVNLRTPLLLSQAVLQNMKNKNWGRIVNISSIFGNISKEYRASYSSSKFGLDGMTVALAAEVSKFGILANCVGPGFIDTELTQNILGRAGINTLKERIPMQRLGKPEEIAAFVSWLVSEENTYLTGQNLIIDGGFSRV